MDVVYRKQNPSLSRSLLLVVFNLVVIGVLGGLMVLAVGSVMTPQSVRISQGASDALAVPMPPGEATTMSVGRKAARDTLILLP